MSVSWPRRGEVAWRAVRWMPQRPQLPAEALLLLTSAYFLVACNGAFWQAVHAAGASPRLQLSLAVAVFCLHAALIGLFAWGRLAKPLLALLLVSTAAAAWCMDRYAVLFDVEMVRNVLSTDVAESRELLGAGMVLRVALAGLLPAALVLAVRVPAVPFWRALRDRAAFLAAMLLLAACALGLSSQGVFALMRSDHALRYRITPGNYIVSLARTLAPDERAHAGPKTPVAADARRVGATHRRPRVVVLVVGETVRGDHWGLNGYARQTTPQLAAREVVNFPDVQACGTSTEVSLPCMFSAFGRERYDRAAIRSHESLLDVLARAGVGVLWRDNQSGCKGVCDGVGMQTMAAGRDDALCRAGRCLDEILLSGLAERIDAAPDDLLVVLHQLGNHGPNYFERYPQAYERWRPTCRTPELSRCSREELVNAYDNAVLYTDAFLGQVIDLLARQRSHDAAMLYVSDHGESLGEYGLYLHGAPYAIAPKQQLHVPMTLWLSDAYAAGAGIDRGCLGAGAAAPRSHDDLFHSLLAMFDVATRDYRPERDLFRSCRAQAAAAAG